MLHSVLMITNGNEGKFLNAIRRFLFLGGGGGGSEAQMTKLTAPNQKPVTLQADFLS